MSPDYAIVPEHFQDAFVEACKEAYLEMHPKDPQETGNIARIVNDHHVQRVKRLLDGTKGEVVLGGKINEETKFCEATIIKNVKLDDILMSEEIFAPILPVVPVKDTDEAIRVINSLSVMLLRRSSGSLLICGPAGVTLSSSMSSRAIQRSRRKYLTTRRAVSRLRTRLSSISRVRVTHATIALHSNPSVLIAVGIPFGGVGPSGCELHSLVCVDNTDQTFSRRRYNREGCLRPVRPPESNNRQSVLAGHHDALHALPAVYSKL